MPGLKGRCPYAVLLESDSTWGWKMPVDRWLDRDDAYSSTTL